MAYNKNNGFPSVRGRFIYSPGSTVNSGVTLSVPFASSNILSLDGTDPNTILTWDGGIDATLINFVAIGLYEWTVTLNLVGGASTTATSPAFLSTLLTNNTNISDLAGVLCNGEFKSELTNTVAPAGNGKSCATSGLLQVTTAQSSGLSVTAQTHNVVVQKIIFDLTKLG